MLCICGILLVGIGVSFEVTANVVTLAGRHGSGHLQGISRKICQQPRWEWDLTHGHHCRLLLSLLFLSELVGVREGTVAAAIFVGLTAKQVNRPLKRFADQYLA